MAAPITEFFHQLVLEVETATPGTYAKVCGLKDVTISRATQVDTSEVPGDCEDESIPYSTERSIRALNVTVSASDATWAQQSHEMLMDWYYSGSVKNVRVGHLNAAVGDTEYETGPAILTQLDDTRTKGQKNARSIAFEFDGTPTRTAKAAP
ncbi:phage tail tube protein [Haematobacter genomosp. 1]|uniref:Phage tail protein n=1 Tax=Haematobacter genomosp. 1 TaxID=366618 RepID=A0A212AC39_9RHOB|nr:phage tail tube protein [Haematobacter genomosp. 1]OWJ78421.1 hypothetical protein CDV49_08270 [Haematobacter genomosp. 1]